MAGLVGEPSHHGTVENSPYRTSYARHDESGGLGSSWYFSRKDLEENSPSRHDGIDLKKESYLRKSYCAFLQDLGMRLKVPQVTIATAIVFCHRFFLRQSHAKNDRRTIATVCMFLAGKVEETPRPLRDVIIVSYEIIHKKDPVAVQKIKQKEVYEQQKELILLGERVVLATLGFDFNVHHPYKPLVEAIKKFKVAQNALAQVAWNFVNDGLRTSLCLQFMPHHIAAGAIFLAAKFLKVKLPHDGEKVWWQEFDVTPRQLEEVSNQMLELYEQNRVAQPSQQTHGNETEGSSASMVNQRIAAKPGTQNTALTDISNNHGYEQPQPDRHYGSQKLHHNESNECEGHRARNNGPNESQVEADARDSSSSQDLKILPDKLINQSIQEHNYSYEEKKAVIDFGGTKETIERAGNNTSDGLNVSSPMMDAMKDKVKAALEKRRKSKGDSARKVDLWDEDELIERELEHGVEQAVEGERSKHGGRKSWCSDQAMDNNAEEGELSIDSQDVQSPKSGAQKRWVSSPGNQHVSHAALKCEGHDDGCFAGRFERADRDPKRLRTENHAQ